MSKYFDIPSCVIQKSEVWLDVAPSNNNKKVD